MRKSLQVQRIFTAFVVMTTLSFSAWSFAQNSEVAGVSSSSSGDTTSSPTSSGFCPQSVIDEVRDASSGSFVQVQTLAYGTSSAQSRCFVGQPKLTPQSLETMMSQNDLTDVGVPDGTLTKCFSTAQVTLGMRDRQPVKSAALNPEQQKVAIGDYYQKANSLQTAIDANLQSVASIDSILGKSSGKNTKQCPGVNGQILNGITCKNSTPKTGQWCNELKKCSSQGGLDQMAQLALQAKDQINQLRASMKTAQAGPDPVQTQNGPVPKQQYMTQVSQLIQAVNGSAPWIQGSVYAADMSSARAKKIGDTPDIEAQAIGDQLCTDRQKLASKLKDQQDALACLDTSNCKNPDIIDEATSGLPPYQIPTITDSASARVVTGSTNVAMDIGKCYDDDNKETAESNETTKEIAESVAITAATLPISAALEGAAATGALVAATAETTAAAKNTMTLGYAARAALYGKLLYDKQSDIMDAIKKCSPHSDVLNPREIGTASNIQCPDKPYGGPNTHDQGVNGKQCVTNLLVQGALLAAPAAGNKAVKMLSHEGSEGVEETVQTESEVAATAVAGASTARAVSSTAEKAEFVKKAFDAGAVVIDPTKNYIVNTSQGVSTVNSAAPNSLGSSNPLTAKANQEKAMNYLMAAKPSPDGSTPAPQMPVTFLNGTTVMKGTLISAGIVLNGPFKGQAYYVVHTSNGGSYVIYGTDAFQPTPGKN